MKYEKKIFQAIILHIFSIWLLANGLRPSTSSGGEGNKKAKKLLGRGLSSFFVVIKSCFYYP
jgi:hypothetical protein